MDKPKIIVSKYAGACYGVKRALDLVETCLQEHKYVQTLGEVIHNPVVTENFKLRGVEVIEKAEDATYQSVVLRSHGATPAEIDTIKKVTGNIIDATCPHVKRAQKKAVQLAEDNDMVIIVGKAGHPEVDSLYAYAKLKNDNVICIDSINDVPDELPDRVGVLSQTTFQTKLFETITDAIEAKCKEADIANTICLATEKRQDATRKLARKVDAMIIIGGKNSSNTTRLYEISCEENDTVFHIERARELDELMPTLMNCKAIGISAGASTPEWLVDSIKDYLEFNFELEINSHDSQK